MSEKSKGDTSRVVKNPLLSASVTGLTFEDFPNKPLLLPAAPPVVKTTVSTQITNSEEYQASVTVGQKPDIDTETLSEINLNATTDDEGNNIDLNDKQNLEFEAQDGSILSQAASSFSQLPTVASTVLSTFSKVIKDYSPSGNTGETYYKEKETFQSTNSEEILSPYSVPPPFSDSNLNYQQDYSINEPPRLYSPSDISLSTPLTSRPSVVGSQNNYRLISAKKKTYAQIPGLLSINPQTSDQPFLNPVDANKNFAKEGQHNLSPANLNIPPTLEVQPNNTYISPQQKAEEQKGLFSFSNLVPPVWQNISSLVKSSDNTEVKKETTPENNQLGTSERVSTFAPINLPQPPQPFIGSTTSFNQNIVSVPQASIPLIPLQPPKHITATGVELDNSQNILNSSVDVKTSNLHGPPPKPPIGSAVNNTFRLQKGTRHYRSSFDSPILASTAPPPPVPPILVPASNCPPCLPFSSTVGSENITVLPVQPNSFDIPSVTSFPEPNKNLSSSTVPFYNSIKSSEISAEFHQNIPEAVSQVDEKLIASKQEFHHQSSAPILEAEKVRSVTASSAISTNENIQIYALKASEKKESDLTPLDTKLGIEPSVGFFSSLDKLPFQKTAEQSIQVTEPVSLNRKIDVPNTNPTQILFPQQSSNPVQQIPKPKTVDLLQANFAESINIFTPNRNQTSNIELSLLADRNLSNQTTELPSHFQPQPSSSEHPFNLATYFNTSTNICKDLDKQDVDLAPQFDHKINQPLSGPVKHIVPDANLENSNKVNFFGADTNFTYKENTIPTTSEPTLLPDPLSFFDSFHQQPANQTDFRNNETITSTEDSNSLRIQDFFNNPPQSINDSGSDLNYKLVGSGITEKRLNNLLAPSTDSRALSPVSNIVEPPSSSCSEFSSEFTAQIVGNLSGINKEDLPDELIENFEMAGLLGTNSSGQQEPYRAVTRHWFYNKIVDTKYIWTPFSYIDSKLLEDNFLTEEGKNIVAVEGGRYDVNIPERIRMPVYWTGESTEVRRCSWFYKAIDSKYVPYEEAIADLLEEEYKEASESGEWHRKLALPTGETVVFHGPTVIVHFLQAPPTTDVWASTSQTPARPRVVKRDIADFNIETGEPVKVDHILFMVHGVGSACDLKFRPLEEVVDEFRSIATQLIQSHYKDSCQNGLVGRVEVLPVSWHSQLHSGESGIDEKLKAITLESIPKLRNFTNDTLLDILFYTSPIFCQNIMNTVCDALNKMYTKYCQRNPSFNGGVSLAGHSLGSLILFDLLCHQKPSEDMEISNSENPDQIIQPLQLSPQLLTDSYQPISQQVSYTMGSAGTGQPFINYPQLIFHPKKFFALGSPIGMFVTIRGIDALGLDFKLPTCGNFFHIFHPYDPVAYRIEALINPDLRTARPVLIPHHKGRKRMHLELKETMTRVGADLKQRFFDTFKTTFDSVNFLSSKNKTEANEEIEKEVDKVLEMQLQLETSRSRTTSSSTQSDVDTGEIDLPLGKLNDQRRIDYVLQEAPLEFFNEYLFAFASHVCYWESEDTILFIMKEIYSSVGIRTDSQIPQQSMTIERPNSS